MSAGLLRIRLAARALEREGEPDAHRETSAQAHRKIIDRKAERRAEGDAQGRSDR